MPKRRQPIPGLVGLLAIALANEADRARAAGWETNCGRSDQETTTCRHNKEEAILNGGKGTLHTIVFPDGEKRQYFYTGGWICDLKDLRVRSLGGPWSQAIVNCPRTQANRLVFQLPSGSTVLWIDTAVD